ncbi:hypothetical protein B0H14DRAFT_2923209, partial [Mycena olivaceomarginata]
MMMLTKVWSLPNTASATSAVTMARTTSTGNTSGDGVNEVINRSWTTRIAPTSRLGISILVKHGTAVWIQQGLGAGI